jgi:hypothetical protein
MVERETGERKLERETEERKLDMLPPPGPIRTGCLGKDGGLGAPYRIRSPIARSMSEESIEVLL